MTEHAIQWITHYGYFGIFIFLILGIVGLPVPDEWLLVISGYLAFKNVLGFVPTVVVAVMGSAIGLTVSYVLGRTSSNYVVQRYGRWLSLDDEKLLRVQHWFQNFGRWVLIIGPFVPGVRNLMGYVAGAAKLRIHVFARFAYMGAFISSVTFVTFGYLAGKHLSWNYSRVAIIGGIAAGAIFTASGLPVRLLLTMKRMIAAAIPAKPAC